VKKTPIDTHKDSDIKLMRTTMLKIIKDEDVTKKDRIEAAKLLARMHHALQVDRTTVKGDTKSGPDIEPEKQEEILDRVDEIINANLYGRKTPPS
jgi:hypothetical protein